MSCSRTARVSWRGSRETPAMARKGRTENRCKPEIGDACQTDGCFRVAMRGLPLFSSRARSPRPGCGPPPPIRGERWSPCVLDELCSWCHTEVEGEHFTLLAEPPPTHVGSFSRRCACDAEGRHAYFSRSLSGYDCPRQPAMSADKRLVLAWGHVSQEKCPCHGTRTFPDDWSLVFNARRVKCTACAVDTGFAAPEGFNVASRDRYAHAGRLHRHAFFDLGRNSVFLNSAWGESVRQRAHTWRAVEITLPQTRTALAEIWDRPHTSRHSTRKNWWVSTGSSDRMRRAQVRAP